MATETQRGRADLARWIESRPANYYLATPNLRSVLAHRAGPARTEAAEPSLSEFGRVMAEVVEPAVVTLELHREFPAHVPSDPDRQTDRGDRVPSRPPTCRPCGLGLGPARGQPAGEGSVRAGVPLLPPLVGRRRRPQLPCGLHRRTWRGPSNAVARPRCRSVTSRALRGRLRPQPPRVAVPHRGPRRLRRRSERGASGAGLGGFLGMAHQRREVVLLGRRRRALRGHRAHPREPMPALVASGASSYHARSTARPRTASASAA